MEKNLDYVYVALDLRYGFVRSFTSNWATSIRNHGPTRLQQC